MRSIVITLVLLAAGSTISLAQCDKTLTLTSSKTQHFDSQGALKHADDEKVVIQLTPTDMSVSINNDGGEHKMSGKIKSGSCDWKVPFKEGQTKFTVALSNDDGESRDFNMTITGKDGKVTFTAESNQEPDDVIKLDIEKFEEKS